MCQQQLQPINNFLTKSKPLMSSTFNTLPIEGNYYYTPNNYEIQHIDSDKLSETSTNSSQEPNDLSNSKLKRSLCRNYVMNGYCPYGFKCQFAHGTEELQCNVNEKFNYKTKACVAFAKKGFCPYGERCNYIHKTSMKKKNCKIIYENFGEIFREQKYESIASEGKSPLLTSLDKFNQKPGSEIQIGFPSLNIANIHTTLN